MLALPIEFYLSWLAQHGQFTEADDFAEWPDGTLAMRYGFRHALYQQGVYERLSSGQRVRLHRLIGERKEAAYRGHETEVASELAGHFERGREPGKAVWWDWLVCTSGAPIVLPRKRSSSMSTVSLHRLNRSEPSEP
jgi:hypothetical protein